MHAGEFGLRVRMDVYIINKYSEEEVKKLMTKLGGRREGIHAL